MGIALCLALLLQDDKPPDQEVIVTTSPLRAKDVFDTPWSADVLLFEEFLDRRLSMNVPSVFKELPGILVQRTAHGHGSPFIRGFTGFRNVLLVDGIRLNHSGYREGPNQYWNTLDEFLIDRLEIVRGPSSVLYGSDSIGGTVIAYTKEPKFEKGTHIHARAYYRYASAEDSHTARVETWGNAGDFGWFAGGTYRDFHDIDGGRDIGEMPETGFDEYDTDVKLLYRPTEKSKLVLAFQHTRQDDVPRTHRTIFSRSWHGTRVGTDLRADFDQERDLVYLQYRAQFEEAFLDDLRASVSWQRTGEQFERRTSGNPSREVREFEIDTAAAWVQAGKDSSIGYFTFGLDVYHDMADSEGHDWLQTDALREFTRGEIADDAKYTTFGLYVQDEFTIGDFDFTPGLRFSWARVKADEVDPDPNGSVIPDDIRDRYSAVTGSLRILYRLAEEWNIIAGWGMGFRAPSLDDSTSLKLVLSGTLELPAEDLDPEKTHTFDLGVRTKYKKFEASAFVFYTILDDLIRRVPVAGGLSKDNFAEGWVWGFEIAGTFRFSDEVSVWADWAYVKGRADALVDGKKQEEPLDKVNPMTGHLGLRYEPKGIPLWFEAVATLVREQKHLSPGDTGDTQRIPPDGTPGYGVLTIRAGYRLSENFGVTLAVENIANKDYRHHGSGQNEPGTNAILGVDARF